MKFVTSDQHFYHPEIILYENRPFKDVTEMNNVMKDNWNVVVGVDDTVYHLGDFALKCSREQLTNLISSLNGYKILVLGSHDGSRKKLLDCGFDEVYKNNLILYDRRLVLKHEGNWNLPSLNVSVENWDYYPIPLPRAREWLQLCGHSHSNWIVKI